MNKLAVPDEILCIAEKLKEAQASLFLVGGSVRDLLLNIEPLEYDFEIFAGEALREQYQALTDTEKKQEMIAAFISDVLAILTDFSGIKEVGKSFGVHKMEGRAYDFSFPRSEIKAGDTRRDYDVTVQPFLDTRQAQKRRDLTINSLLYDPLTAQLTDHFGGLSDLENKILRHVDPETFIEDPLRVYRIAQFASRLGFSVDPETLNLSSRVEFSHLSLERIDAEWEKMFNGDDIQQGLLFLFEADVLRKNHPKLQEMFQEHKEVVFSDAYLDPISQAKSYEEKMAVLFLLLQNIKTQDVICLAKRVLAGITRNKGCIRRVIGILSVTDEFEKYYQRSQSLADTIYHTYKNKEMIRPVVMEIHEHLYRRKKQQESSEGEQVVQLAIAFEPVITGRDIIRAGIRPSADFQRYLRQAAAKQLEGKTKEQIIQELLTEKKEG